jgi:hypothetical protein
MQRGNVGTVLLFGVGRGVHEFATNSAFGK